MLAADLRVGFSFGLRDHFHREAQYTQLGDNSVIEESSYGCSGVVILSVHFRFSFSSQKANLLVDRVHLGLSRGASKVKRTSGSNKLSEDHRASYNRMLRSASQSVAFANMLNQTAIPKSTDGPPRSAFLLRKADAIPNALYS